MDTHHTVLRSARHFLSGTFLSRISGLARDMAMAFSFGSSVEIAAFLVAFRLANLFRRLLGEGNLQAAFVPQFESLRHESFDRAAHFYRETALSMAVLSGAVVAGSELILWAALGFLPGDWREIGWMTMQMLPGLFFLCLSGINVALLQTQKKYFWPAAAPIAFNAVWIVGALLTKQVSSLSLWVAGAAGMQWLMTAIHVRSELKGAARRFLTLFSPDWRRLIVPMALGLIGIGAVQINSALDAIFARLADPSGPAYLWYAIRVQQLPLALFGIALSGALLPPLSRSIKEGNLGTFYTLLKGGLRKWPALMIPCTFGLLALGKVGLNVLYLHGQFLKGDVQQTLYCLWAYGAGLLPAVFVLLLAQGFYAKKSYWAPAKASVISVGVNCLLNAFFVFGLHWGAVSIALATTLSAFVNCLVLASQVGKGGEDRYSNRPGSEIVQNVQSMALFDAPFARFCARLSFASIPSAAVVLALQTIQWLPTSSFLQKVVQLIILSGIYVGMTIGLSMILKIDELRDFLGKRPLA